PGGSPDVPTSLRLGGPRRANNTLTGGEPLSFPTHSLDGTTRSPDAAGRPRAPNDARPEQSRVPGGISLEHRGGDASRLRRRGAKDRRRARLRLRRAPGAHGGGARRTSVRSISPEGVAPARRAAPALLDAAGRDVI